MSTLTVHTDGGSRGNPGSAATGVVILFNDEVVLDQGKYLGIQTNNEAEYQAVAHSLELLPEVLKKHKVSKIVWKLDSMLVVQQLNKAWKIKEPRLTSFAMQIWKKLPELSIPYDFTYVPRAENHLADAVVNKTLDLQAKS
jgi:ribonuclease HI